jgi:hypothetical protein
MEITIAIPNGFRKLGNFDCDFNLLNYYNENLILTINDAEIREMNGYKSLLMGARMHGLLDDFEEYCNEVIIWRNICLKMD